jgi:alpha-galactosidase
MDQSDLKLDNCYIPDEWQDECVHCRYPNHDCIGYVEKLERSYAYCFSWKCPPDYDWTKSKSMMRFMRMKNALDNQTRPILYSLCNGGEANIHAWAPLVGQSWRSTGDIFRKFIWMYVSPRI